MFTITLNKGKEQRSFEINESDSLLVGAEKNLRQDIPVGCRGGGCGVCKIKILSGKYLSKRMSKAHVGEEEALLGYVLACRIYPLSDLSITMVDELGANQT